MTIERIDHVQLAMPAGGEAAARSFYGELLDLAEQPKPPHLAARGGCWFESGAVKVHLGIDKDFKPAGKAHPAFIVGDLDSLCVRLGHMRGMDFSGIISYGYDIHITLPA